MGCSDSKREEITPEELAISAAEKDLGFSRYGARQYDLVFKRYSSDGKTLSDKQFNEALLLLKLH